MSLQDVDEVWGGGRGAPENVHAGTKPWDKTVRGLKAGVSEHVEAEGGEQPAQVSWRRMNLLLDG